jgi:hypothetical protein
VPEIRVQLLDYKTGHPVRGRHILLTLANANGKYALDAVPLEGKTGADGAATFRFKTERAPRIWVVTPDDFECSEPRPRGYDTDAIIQQGIIGNIVGVQLCRHHTSTLQETHPGELVFYIHRLNLWQRIRRSIEE